MPTCYRCQEYGTSCKYKSPRPLVVSLESVPPRAHSSHLELVPIQPRPQMQLTSGPSSVFLSDEVEGRYFRLFQEKLAFDLSGYSGSTFWIQMIPQQCHHDPGIKHAITALSALYKSAISSKTHTIDLADEHVRYALLKQSKAISSLRQTLSCRKPQLRLALVASLLFSCFESFHGDWQTATQQIYSGFSILKNLTEGKGQHVKNDLIDIDLEVSRILHNLELQILAFFAMNPMSDHPFNDLVIKSTLPVVPERFLTLNEAFAVATDLVASVLRHSRTAARCGDDPESHEWTVQQQQYLQEVVRQWNVAYEPFFLKARNITNREQLNIHHVRICLWTCEIIIVTSMSYNEIVFDIFTAQFETINHYARQLLQKDQGIRRLDGMRLQYGMGLIMVLFYTATRCRVLSVRRGAISLLREWPCTNGIWHSLQAAKVAELIAGIEETGCETLGIIPESRRRSYKDSTFGIDSH
ncbi:hypothetical protein LSUE1_G001284 [Lachnellula suecica]|uniref:Uncharacterized protein n=1 Tax=Lachnellula suecica TaxID=602035 RepID=A0A8T9CK32_9HELO|nr:hypothetical protein LSUE1_G001284 [Lachnellula suecica]